MPTIQVPGQGTSRGGDVRAWRSYTVVALGAVSLLGLPLLLLPLTTTEVEGFQTSPVSDLVEYVAAAIFGIGASTAALALASSETRRRSADGSAPPAAVRLGRRLSQAGLGLFCAGVLFYALMFTLIWLLTWMTR